MLHRIQVTVDLHNSELYVKTKQKFSKDINRPFYRTDTAAILNKFDLRSIIGYPGGMSTFRLHFLAVFGTFFLKFS